MLGRVTSTQLYANSQSSIGQVKQRLSSLQQQASSGLAISKPSDDPTATAAVLKLRSDIAANTQYGTNIADGLSWLATTDSVLSKSEDLVRQAKDLTIQAANSGTSSAASREAIAVQLDGLKQDLLAQANTTYLGRSVFAATSDRTAFDSTTNAFQGVPGSAGTVARRISGTETVTVSADGAAAFGTPATPAVGTTPAVPSTSVFDALDAVVAALRSPTYDTDTSRATITSGIDALGASLTRLSAQHAVVGSNYARLETAKARNTDAATSLEVQRSNVQDVDATSVLLDLKTQELAYQTALQVTAQVLQPTLMSFLR